MKIKILRQLLNEYDHSWSFRKMVYGDHQRAIHIRNYVALYQNEPDDYQLTPHDLFILVKCLTKLNDSLRLIKKIKSYFDQNYFFEIIDKLDQNNILDEKNFSTIYLASYQARVLLYDLFIPSLSKKAIPLSQTVFDMVLKWFDLHHNKREIEKTMRLLESCHLLDRILFDFFDKKVKQAFCFAGLFKELERANCLDQISLTLLMEVKFIFPIVELLTFLNDQAIIIDHSFLASICHNEAIPYVNKIINIITQPHLNFLSTDHLKYLTESNLSFYLEKYPLIKLLADNNLLDLTNFEIILTGKATYVSRIANILSSISALKDNKVMIDLLLKQEVKPYPFYRVINYLYQAKLLNNYSLTLCWYVALESKNNNDFKNDFYSLIVIMEEANFTPSQTSFETLLLLSLNNLARLRGVVSSLAEAKILDQASFDVVLTTINEKLPPVKSSLMVKTSRKQSGLPRSMLCLDNQLSFFMDHSGKYKEGGYGKVKKGYGALNQTSPKYSIKRLHPQVTTPVLEATREVKYQRLLGRQAFYFSQDANTSIISEWQKGIDLEAADKNAIMKAPFETRLKCLLSGLSDLNELHRHYRVHGDVKFSNFILNLKNGTMHLIDFGGAHKAESAKSFAQTRIFSEPFSSKGCSGDMYSMGFVTAALFPELYAFRVGWRYHLQLLKQNSVDLKLQAIITLVNSMMHSSGSKRCTSEDAMHFCQEMLSHLHDLNDNNLNQIIKATIQRDDINVQDVLRGASRASP